MVRPRIIKDGRILSVVLGLNHREIIENMRGSKSWSEFVRDSIELRQPEDDYILCEIKKWKEKLEFVSKEFEDFKKDTLFNSSSQEDTELLKVTSDQYTMYLKSNPHSTDPGNRHDWLSARCKGNKMTPEQIITFHAKTTASCRSKIKYGQE